MVLKDWINGTTNFRDPYAFDPWPVDLISPKVTRFDGLEAGERQFLSLSDLPGDVASGHSRIKCPGWGQRNQTLGEPVPRPSGLLERSPRGGLLPKNCRRGGDLYKAPRS